MNTSDRCFEVVAVEADAGEARIASSGRFVKF